MRNNLFSDETKEAYINQFDIMRKNCNSIEGDKFFLSKVLAVSEQIDNLHVKANVGNLIIENDGPKDIGGSGTIP
ncbi:MAG: hypothetical protein ACFFG0_31260 [Candidatus Thorarchaeota archaeon]